MYRRFISDTITKVFERIAKMDVKEHVKKKMERKAFNNLGGFSYPPNGTKECARRRDQIAAGQLRRENGLADD